MTDTMSIAEIITAATGLISNFQGFIYVGAIIGAGTLLLSKVKRAAR